ncbi:DUF4012 domain-containing protein [Mycetocola sp.]|uniref:DUF4012 domain-containing protein n=1 Tax=Mycetocola sp. TaxID=1871042 RepID=UPI0039895A29
MTTPRSFSKRKTASTPLLLALVVLIFGMVTVSLWIGIRGASAASELSTARSFASALRTEMVDGNVQDATTTLGRAATHTQAAVLLTSDPVWRAVELVPVVGSNLSAVRVSAQAVDDLVTEVAATLLPLAGELNASSFAGTSIPLEPLQEMAPGATKARDAAEAIAGRVAEIETGSTLPFVRKAVTELTDLVGDVTTTVQSIQRATALMPGMLGADGQRNYLVLFQNSAELRASGGVSGATAVLAASGGNLALAAQKSIMDYPVLPEPALPLSPVEVELYSTLLARQIQDVNRTPDFSRTGAIAKTMAEPVVGMRIDGVVTIDPYVLSYVLTATGPVRLDNGAILSSDNAVQMLLSDIYDTVKQPADQDRFFASVARAAFTALNSDTVNPARLLSAIVRAGDEGRIRIWSADGAEQSALAETTLAAVPDESDPVLGVYLNDATGAKMSFYLDRFVTVSCERVGVQRVTVQLTNEAPADAATSLPAFVTGGSLFGVPAGSIRTQVLIALPPGARLITRDGVSLTSVQDAAGHVIVSGFVDVKPGESGQIAVSYSNAVPSRVDTTPGLTVNSLARGEARCS